jgi:glycosyltransferase involved in cell wall biosynthesis
MNQPLVSIILPTYNGKSERLSEAINSILTQSYMNFELIILNDASTNNIEEIILEFAKQDKRILYLKNEKNLKLTKTLNKGLKLVKGKYIARMDDDDVWVYPDKLKKQIEFLEAHPDYGLIGTNAIIMDENGEDLYRLAKPTTDKKIKENMLVGNWFVHPSIVMRTSIIKQVGGYDPNWNFVEDYELRIRIGMVSKIENLSDYRVKVRYRKKTGSVTRKNYRKQKRLTFKLFWKYFKFYPKKHLIKALMFRIGELVVPQAWTLQLLKMMKRVRV